MKQGERVCVDMGASQPPVTGLYLDQYVLEYGRRIVTVFADDGMVWRKWLWGYSAVLAGVE